MRKAHPKRKRAKTGVRIHNRKSRKRKRRIHQNLDGASYRRKLVIFAVRTVRSANSTAVKCWNCKRKSTLYVRVHLKEKHRKLKRNQTISRLDRYWRISPVWKSGRGRYQMD
jgi:hypothetical protein